jgi:hypothetical protein
VSGSTVLSGSPSKDLPNLMVSRPVLSIVERVEPLLVV